MSYKENHESFVSNLAGSNVWSIVICVSHVPALILLLKYLQSTTVPSFLRDFLVFTLPLLFILTIASSYAYWSLLILLLCSILLYRTRFNEAFKLLKYDYKSNIATSTYYLTVFKGSNVLLTCIAILAIDFTAFPREFGKTETFGVSLMDAGVGAFIISSAITSKYARGIDTSKISSKATTAAFAIPYQKLFVLLLGVGRMVALKAINYQEHVSEYGVHWNFFVTLFCVWSVADIVHCLSTDRLRVAMLSGCHLLVYQMALLHTPLTEYMMSQQRDGLISDNKEGLFSLNGYIPLYLISECLAYYVFFNEGKLNGTAEGCHHTHTSSCAVNQSGTKGNINGVSSDVLIDTVLDCQCETHSSSYSSSPFYRMTAVSIIFWLVWIVSAGIAQPTSRRLVNIAYCSLTIALSMSTVMALFLVEALTTSGNAKPIPTKTLEYMSKHSLMVFLLANLMTGLVNKTFQTIHMSTVHSMIILSGYCLYLTLIAWGSEKFLSTKR